MWGDPAYLALLRPCRGGWPHLLYIEALKYEDRISIRCQNCGSEAPRLTGEEAKRVCERNQARIEAAKKP